MASTYAVGIDFGTESGRAVLVDVATGNELATAVYDYENGVIDERLPAPHDDVRLEPDWALQDPEDYLRTFQIAVPSVLERSGVDPSNVIGVGIDFTACTMLPTTADGTPLCTISGYRRRPHAWTPLTGWSWTQRATSSSRTGTTIGYGRWTPTGSSPPWRGSGRMLTWETGHRPW